MLNHRPCVPAPQPNTSSSAGVNLSIDTATKFALNGRKEADEQNALDGAVVNLDDVDLVVTGLVVDLVVTGLVVALEVESVEVEDIEVESVEVASVVTPIDTSIVAFPTLPPLPLTRTQ
jgi:hypothetical protein